MDNDVPAAERTCWIYGLYDPETGELRYIGKSVQPRRRLQCHIRDAKVISASCRRNNWIRSVLDRGLYPRMELLEEVAESRSSSTEMRHIAEARSAGARLVNGTDGGEGASGYRPTSDARERIRQSLMGRKHSPEARERMRAAVLGRKCTPEAVEKSRVAHIGLKRSPETRARMSASLIGLKDSPETIEKNRASHVGLKPTAEARLNMSTAQKKRRHREREGSVAA